MPSWLEATLSAANPAFYPVFSLALLLAGLCMPISADLVLLTAGYLAYQGQAAYGVLIPLALVSILIADTLMFGIGKRYGKRVLGVWPFRKVFTSDRVARTEASFQRLGYRVVFLARFMPGIRTVFMFTSGTLGLNYGKFILHDLAGALIVIPGTIYSVRLVAGNLELIRSKIEQGQWSMFGAALVAGIAFLLWKRFRLKASSGTR